MFEGGKETMLKAFRRGGNMGSLCIIGRQVLTMDFGLVAYLRASAVATLVLRTKSLKMIG